MSINVVYVATDYLCQFVPYNQGKRLWITEPTAWYASVGWCPHLNIGNGECSDCSLIIEEE